MINKVKIQMLHLILNIRNCEINEIFQWIFVLLVISFSFFTMTYEDFMFIAERPYTVLREACTGNVKSIEFLFYSNYGFTLWLAIMVWNIPLLLANLIMESNFSMELPGALLWTKLGFFLFSLLMVVALKKITSLYKINKKNEKELLLVTFSSALYVIPVLQLSQCDIISLMFALWGLYFYLNKKNKLFILMFAIANPMKYFTLFIFAPLVLLRWKKIREVVVYLFEGFSLILINLIMRRFTINQWSEPYNSGVMQQFLQIQIDSTEMVNTSQPISELEKYLGTIVSGVSIFILLFLIVCIIAYAIKEDDNISSWPIYLSFIVFASFFIFYDNPAYRLILLCPFMILLIYIDKRWHNLSLGLETCAGISFILIKLKEAAWVIGGNKTFERLLLKGKTIGGNLSDYLYGRYELDQYISIFKTICVASIIGLVFLHFPMLQRNKYVEEEKTEQILIWGRVAFIILWTILNVYALLI